MESSPLDRFREMPEELRKQIQGAVVDIISAGIRKVFIAFGVLITFNASVLWNTWRTAEQNRVELLDLRKESVRIARDQVAMVAREMKMSENIIRMEVREELLHGTGSSPKVRKNELDTEADN